MLLDTKFNIILICVFILCVLFAWLADVIWKISGRKTYYLINMAQCPFLLFSAFRENISKTINASGRIQKNPLKNVIFSP